MIPAPFPSLSQRFRKLINCEHVITPPQLDEDALITPQLLHDTKMYTDACLKAVKKDPTGTWVSKEVLSAAMIYEKKVLDRAAPLPPPPPAHVPVPVPVVRSPARAVDVPVPVPVVHSPARAVDVPDSPIDNVFPDSPSSSVSSSASASVPVAVPAPDLVKLIQTLQSTFDTFQTQLTTMSNDIREIRADVNGLRTDVNQLRTDVNTIKNIMDQERIAKYNKRNERSNHHIIWPPRQDGTHPAEGLRLALRDWSDLTRSRIKSRKVEARQILDFYGIPDTTNSEEIFIKIVSLLSQKYIPEDEMKQHPQPQTPPSSNSRRGKRRAQSSAEEDEKKQHPQPQTPPSSNKRRARSSEPE